MAKRIVIFTAIVDNTNQILIGSDENLLRVEGEMSENWKVMVKTFAAGLGIVNVTSNFLESMISETNGDFYHFVAVKVKSSVSNLLPSTSGAVWTNLVDYKETEVYKKSPPFEQVALDQAIFKVDYSL